MNLLIAQSGGPTAVINATLAGAITEALEQHFTHIYGSLNGITGIMEHRLVEIDKEAFCEKEVAEALKRRPSSILRSCRFQLPADPDDVFYDHLFANLRALAITHLIYIGGNDSMDTVMKLNIAMRQRGITDLHIGGAPKTIDNDLCGMDHSPGFASAAKYVNNTLITIRNDIAIYAEPSCTIVEIMGRNAGWLAASAVACNGGQTERRVDLLYLGEHPQSLDAMMEEIAAAVKSHRNVLVAISEGYRDIERLLERRETVASQDAGFHHPVLSGVAANLADEVHTRLGIKTRSVELSITQRTAALLSATDVEEAFLLGRKAVLANLHDTNRIPVLLRESSDPYTVTYDAVPSETIANREKKIPQDWFQDRDTLEQKMCTYVLPLLQGEMAQRYENGLLKFIALEDFTKEVVR